MRNFIYGYISIQWNIFLTRSFFLKAYNLIFLSGSRISLKRLRIRWTMKHVILKVDCGWSINGRNSINFYDFERVCDVALNRFQFQLKIHQLYESPTRHDISFSHICAQNSYFFFIFLFIFFQSQNHQNDQKNMMEEKKISIICCSYIFSYSNWTRLKIESLRSHSCWVVLLLYVQLSVSKASRLLIRLKKIFFYILKNFPTFEIGIGKMKNW